MPMRENDLGAGARYVYSIVAAEQAVRERNEEAAVRLILGNALRAGWDTEELHQALEVLDLLPAAKRVRKQISERSSDVVRTG